MRIPPVLNRLVIVCLSVTSLIACASGGAARAADNRAPRIVYVSFGDSLTTCAGVADPATQCYPALLARHLPTGGTYDNIATEGAGIDDALGLQLPQALTKHATLATIMVGTLDAVNGVAVTEYATKLGRLLSALRRAHVRTFVANLNDFRAVPGVTNPEAYVAIGHAYNAAIAALGARYGAPIVDIYAASKLLWGHPAYVYDDGLHLTVAGQRALAAVYYRVMHRHDAL